MKRFDLMLMTGDASIARAAEDVGVERIFVDLEIRGKADRQRGRATIISGHTFDDVRSVRAAVRRAELLVRINSPYEGTRDEIDKAIAAGADVLMLPYFTTDDEVRTFAEYVSGRARTCLLVETAAAVVRIDRILAVEGVDEIHVGLNDLHASMGLSFMYELLAGGILDHIAQRVRSASRRVRFGFGGGARIGTAHPVAPADVLREHARLGSEMVILSRTFTGEVRDAEQLRRTVDLAAEIGRIRDVLRQAWKRTDQEVEADRVRIWHRIWEVAAHM